MFTKCFSLVKEGLVLKMVEIETDVSLGLFSFSIIGLADKCIIESKERIVSAIKNSGIKSPKTSNHKIVTSLVPANIKKEGTDLDLAIAIGYLCSTKIVSDKSSNEKISNSIFIGELGLDSSIKNGDKILCSYILSDQINSGVIKNIIGNFKPETLKLVKNYFVQFRKQFSTQFRMPAEENINIQSLPTLSQVINYLNGSEMVGADAHQELIDESDSPNLSIEIGPESLDKEDRVVAQSFDAIIGQDMAKRALTIAIAGKHNLIFCGPPGVGKTHLLKCSQKLLPTTNIQEKISLIATGNILTPLNTDRPFICPHPNTSIQGMMGSNKEVGAVLSAHNGVLFLDEFPEFHINVLESLRTALEGQEVNVQTKNHNFSYRSNFICFCACNLCPCGKAGTNNNVCECSVQRKNKYRQKISEPFLDRFPLRVKLFERSDKLMRKIEIGRSDSFEKIKKIIKLIHTVPPNNIVYTTPETTAVFLEKYLNQKDISYRGVNQIKSVIKTIALVEWAENCVQNRMPNCMQNTSQNKQNQQRPTLPTEKNKIEIVIQEKHILEALSYRKNIFEN